MTCTWLLTNLLYHFMVFDSFGKESLQLAFHSMYTVIVTGG